MRYSRREWIQLTGTALALAPLAGPLRSEADEADRIGREATWGDIVAFFGRQPDVENGWQKQRRSTRLNFILRIPFKGGEDMGTERLAGKFVRSRYNRHGELLWYCLSMDERIARHAPWTAKEIVRTRC
jgi:hypothetical protein